MTSHPCEIGSSRRAWPGRLRVVSLLLSFCWFGNASQVAGQVELLKAAKLSPAADRSADMREGFRSFLLASLDQTPGRREELWQARWRADDSQQQLAAARRRLRQMLGAVDPLSTPIEFEMAATAKRPALIAEVGDVRVYRVRWRAFSNVYGEGLLLEPAAPTANVIVLPDADQSVESVCSTTPAATHPPYAWKLAARGCRVVVMSLIDRRADWSGDPAVALTNASHREWIYRQAFTLGRHILGYEIQKTLAAAAWLRDRDAQLPLAIVGYGEGGLVALRAAAIETAVDGVLVSGAFRSRQAIWREPLDRNVYGLLREFGDAEIAASCAPRPVVVEHCRFPIVRGPPAAKPGQRAVAAPGEITTPSVDEVEREVARSRRLSEESKSRISLIKSPPTQPGVGDAAVMKLLTELNVAARQVKHRPPRMETDKRRDTLRRRRQVAELVDHTQQLLRFSNRRREEYWRDTQPSSSENRIAEWETAVAKKRADFQRQLLGQFPPRAKQPKPRARLVVDRPNWTCYEVVLDVFPPTVFSWGYLLVPKDLKPGERRPVVVCQHGLEGQPATLINEDESSRDFAVYKAFAAQLADRGFVTFAPHNFYRGGNEFRTLQRMAHPLGATLFGLTVEQHQQHLDWLKSLPFVDPRRIGFYGLSYGGNTAMRVPAVLTDYRVVIASGDFNEWIYKNVTTDHIHSMIYHNVWEVFEWNLGNTFNHSDLAALIAPRPFMVERGHDDGVARDEWVAWEYARVRRLYAKLGVPDRTEIEFFNGPHAIRGEGTYKFLEKNLMHNRIAND